MVRFAGVDPENGDALFWDDSGARTNAYRSAFRDVVGKPLPDFTGGMLQSLSYKGFDLSAFFKFAVGYSIFRGEGMWVEDNLAGPHFNQLRRQLDAWTPSNRQTNVPEARLGEPNGSQSSTRFLDDADYLRLKNLQLGYTFSPARSQRIKLNIYASAQNLLTFTRFSGMDPEVNRISPGSVYTGGVFFTSPQARKFILGLNLTL